MAFQIKTKKRARIIVDFDNIKSIEKAERRQTRLVNQGYNLKKSTQIGFNKFADDYE